MQEEKLQFYVAKVVELVVATNVDLIAPAIVEAIVVKMVMIMESRLLLKVDLCKSTITSEHTLPHPYNLNFLYGNQKIDYHIENKS
ncbi:MAG: hypothetical protein HDS10_06040 [Bacteroides sp.]|nr:hypothetical protein [Bacteroides sp.]MBD5309971.1 hypothetical protein [Bacteroides sp.]